MHFYFLASKKSVENQCMYAQFALDAKSYK